MSIEFVSFFDTFVKKLAHFNIIWYFLDTK